MESDQSMLFIKTHGERIVGEFYFHFCIFLEDARIMYIFKTWGKTMGAVKVHWPCSWGLLRARVLERGNHWPTDSSLTWVAEQWSSWWKHVAKTGVATLFSQRCWVARQLPTTLLWCYLGHSVSSAKMTGRCVRWRHASLCWLLQPKLLLSALNSTFIQSSSRTLQL